MKKLITLFFIALLFKSHLFSQTASWYTLPGAPFNSIKIDDCFFINENTGWVINGNIARTTNGGQTWQSQTGNIGNTRCIGFGDSLNGWVGFLSGSPVMYRTTNGGINWIAVQNFPPPQPAGLCGVFAVNSSTVYACGRYYGPARVIKTTNAGQTWTNIDMSSYAKGLVDCYFFNPDSGFVVGGIDSFYQFSKSVVLFTSNGGNTWENRYTGSLNAQWCWKIHFTSQSTGYVSVESYRYTDTATYLKTTNGGSSWQTVNFQTQTDSFHHQGIMFLSNNLTGWVGGYPGPPPFGNGETYQTTDGGATWTPQYWGFNVNRFRYINDSLVYAVGKTVYKYTTVPIGINPISNQIPKEFMLHQNYPNPFNPSTRIKFEIPAISTEVQSQLNIYDALGREIAVLVNESLKPGIYETVWDDSNQPSGIYFYRLTAGKYSESKKMILIK